MRYFERFRELQDTMEYKRQDCTVVLGQKDISPRFMLTQRIIGRKPETKNLIRSLDRMLWAGRICNSKRLCGDRKDRFNK